MNRIKISALIIALLLVSSFSSFAKVNVVTTLPDLASIASEIGKDKIKVISLAKGYQDPHFVDPKPSFLLKLKKADLFVEVGMDLEIGWVPPLLHNARNSKILKGADGFVDASTGIALLQVPTSKVERSEGDIHVYGNPHYWTDPLNGIIIGKNILEGLKKVSPENSNFFESNYRIFTEKLKKSVARWQKALEPYKGAKIIAYHNAWPYFEKRFGIIISGHIEPKPGIPPSPRHISELIGKMKKNNINTIIFSPYFNSKPVESISSETGATIVEMYPSVGGKTELDDYFKVWNYNIESLTKALKGKNR